jgi:hypothetical protein
MALIVNGTEIKSTDTIKYNGTSLTKIIYNTTTVWTKVNTTQLTANYTLYTERTSNKFTYKGIDVNFSGGVPSETQIRVRYSVNSGSLQLLETKTISKGTTTVRLTGTEEREVLSSGTVYVYLEVWTRIEGEGRFVKWEYEGKDPTQNSTYCILTLQTGENYPVWTGGKVGTMYY